MNSTTRKTRKRKRKRMGKTRDVLSDVDGETSDSRGSMEQQHDGPRVTCSNNESGASHTPLGAGLSHHCPEFRPPPAKLTRDSRGREERREERRRKKKEEEERREREKRRRKKKREEEGGRRTQAQPKRREKQNRYRESEGIMSCMLWCHV